MRVLSESLPPVRSCPISLPPPRFERIPAFVSAYVFVALEDDILRGVACYEWKGRDLYFIVLGVDKNCRGKGIAKTLLRKGVELGKERLAKSLTLYTSSNSSSVRFYEALGFRKIGFESFPSANR